MSAQLQPHSDALKYAEELQRTYIRESCSDYFAYKNQGKSRIAANQTVKKENTWLHSCFLGVGASLLAIGAWASLLISFGFIQIESFVILGSMLSVGLLLVGVCCGIKNKPHSTDIYSGLRFG